MLLHKAREKWQSGYDINGKINEKTNEIITEVKEEVKEGYKAEINALVDISLPELKAIIEDEEVSKSVKINAIKVVMDISGLKKETVDNPTGGITQVIINRQPAKMPNDL